MQWQKMVANAYQSHFEEWEKVMEGLTPEDLKKRPSPGANPIGWLGWHCMRSCDRFLGDIILGQQLWIKDGWHKKFNRPADFNDTGVGHTDAQVDALFIPNVKTLLDYEKAVKSPFPGFIEKLTEKDLEKEYPSSQHPGITFKLHERLLRQLAHNYPHIGAAAYARGIIKGQGWYGR